MKPPVRVWVRTCSSIISLYRTKSQADASTYECCRISCYRLDPPKRKAKKRAGRK